MNMMARVGAVQYVSSFVSVHPRAARSQQDGIASEPSWKELEPSVQASPMTLSTQRMSVESSNSKISAPEKSLAAARKKGSDTGGKTRCIALGRHGNEAKIDTHFIKSISHYARKLQLQRAMGQIL